MGTNGGAPSCGREIMSPPSVTSNAPMLSNRKCPTGKVCYLTDIGAKLAIPKIRRSRKREPGKGEWQEYFCHICKCWHLTSKR